MKGLSKRIVGLLILSASYQSMAIEWRFWMSCDELYAEAWKECKANDGSKCKALPSKLTPDCSPDDKHLLKFSNGKVGYLVEKKRLKEESEANIKLVSIVSLHATSPTPQLVKTFRRYEANESYAVVGAELKNLGNKTLQRVQFMCKVILNDAVELYNDVAVSFPNIIPKGTAKTPLHFYDDGDPILSGLYERLGKNYYIPLSFDKRYVESITASCKIIDANFKD